MIMRAKYSTGWPGKIKEMIILLMGPMGCGKTTIGKLLATKSGWPFYDGDDFHPPENVAKMQGGIALTDEDRWVWLETLRELIAQLLQEGTNAILACSALKQAYRDILGVDQKTVITVYLQGSFELLRKRVSERQHPYMSKELLQSQLDTLEEPAGGLTADIAASPEIIVDRIMDELKLMSGIKRSFPAAMTEKITQRKSKMETRDIGLIGLAVMGQNLVINMERNGFGVAVYNRSSQTTADFINGAAAGKNISGTYSVEELLAALKKPRKIMIMVKAGAPVDAVIAQLKPHLMPGDLVLDGGNSHFSDTDRRCREMEALGIHYLGVGVSGGEEGALWGPSIMPGGTRKAYALVEPILRAIAARVDEEPCVAWMGPRGAGHLVKMVHNAIEYGDMQLIAEAYDLLNRGLGLSARQIQEVFSQWKEGPLSSYIIEITAKIFTVIDEETNNPLLEMILDQAGQKGTGRWTVQAALDLGIPVSTISAAIDARMISSYRQERQEAALAFPLPVLPLAHHHDALIRTLGDALYVAKICSYAQGMALLRLASAEYDYSLDFCEIARIWRGGCIIRARLLDDIRAAFQEKPDLANLLLAPFFRDALLLRQEALREIVSLAVKAGIPLPGMSASLAYFDSYRSPRLPTNLIQAQRDYFGAHTYRRVDREGVFHTQWAHNQSAGSY